MKKINITILLISIITVLILTAASFVAAGAVDEGTDGGDFVTLIFSNLFYVFRFPAHPLFWNVMGDNGYVFFGLLGANALLYGFLIERFFSWLR